MPAQQVVANIEIGFCKQTLMVSWPTSDPDSCALLDDLVNTDLEAIETDLNALRPATAPDETRQKPKRALLPPHFPRTVMSQKTLNALASFSARACARRIGYRQSFVLQLEILGRCAAVSGLRQS